MKKKTSSSGVSIAIRNTMFSYKNDKPLIEKSNKQKFEIKIANTLEEREAVFRLAYQVYLEKGYIKENTNKWLLHPFDTSQETVIFIVQDTNKNIAGTVTLVFDSYRKLPADKIYKDELNSLRQSNKKIIEISRLVISPDYRNSREVLVLLFNYLAIYSHHVKNYDNLVIEVNPRHKEYYKSILCFEEIGNQKPCPQVQNAPAVLLNLVINRYQIELNRIHNPLQAKEYKERTLYPYFLKLGQESLVANYLEKQAKPMTADEKIYFGLAESGFSKAVRV